MVFSKDLIGKEVTYRLHGTMGVLTETIVNVTDDAFLATAGDGLRLHEMGYAVGTAVYESHIISVS